MRRRVRGFDLGRQEGARVLRRRVRGFDLGRQDGARVLGRRLPVSELVHASPRHPRGHWLSMASLAKRILLAGQFRLPLPECRRHRAEQPATEPGPASRRHGTAAHANTSGHDQWDRPDDAWSISQRSLKFGEDHQLKLMAFARIVSVRGEYRYLCCFCIPVPCSASVAISEMRYALLGSAAASIFAKDKTQSGQPAGCPERHTGSRIAPCDRIRRRKTIKGTRPRILQDCPCGGDQHEYVQWQAQVAAPEQYWSQVPPASHSPMPWRSFRPPDLRHLRSRQAALPSPSYFWPVHGRITISRSSDIDDHRQPVNSAACGIHGTARRAYQPRPGASARGSLLMRDDTLVKGGVARAGDGGGQVGAAGWSVPGYTGVKALGSGGFGEVVLARHEESGTRGGDQVPAPGSAGR